MTKNHYSLEVEQPIAKEVIKWINMYRDEFNVKWEVSSYSQNKMTFTGIVQQIDLISAFVDGYKACQSH